MNLLIVSASQRFPSQSAKVAQYLKETQTDFTHCEHIDLYQLKIPIWDGDELSVTVKNSDWPSINKLLESTDALILITPEWGGMATPLLKNFLLMCDQKYTAHKPTLLISVVNGISGAYPISELRMNAFKNNKLVPIPDHLIVRHVESRLNDTRSDRSQLHERDQRLRERIDFYLNQLWLYSNALQSVRTSYQKSKPQYQHRYIYGM